MFELQSAKLKFKNIAVCFYMLAQNIFFTQKIWIEGKFLFFKFLNNKIKVFAVIYIFNIELISLQ